MSTFTKHYYKVAIGINTVIKLLKLKSYRDGFTGRGGGVTPLALARGGVGGGAIFHDKAKNY